MENQIYARVHKGVPIELNVTKKQILDRGESIANYLPLYYDFKPKKVPTYSYVKQISKVYPTHVQVQYEVHPMDLESLLLRVWNTDGDLRRPVASVAIGALPPSFVAAIAKAATVYMQQRLDDFANTRSYDDIKSAVTYTDSVIPAFAAEGNRAKTLRDQSWAAFYSYLEQLTNGTKPVPKNVAEILGNCPVLTWE